MILPTIGIILVPGILWGWFFYNFKRYKKIHISILIILFLGGMLSGFFALFLNHVIEKYTVFWPGATGYNLEIFGLKIYIYSSIFWFIVGMNEEFAKLVVLLLVVFHSRHLVEKYDGILFSVLVALGFAVMENFYYLNHYGIVVVIMRTLITLPAHAFMSVPMGYFLAKSRLEIDHGKYSKLGLLIPFIMILLGWSFSAFFHGTYDFLLSVNLEREAYYFILFMGIISFLFIKISLIKKK